MLTRGETLLGTIAIARSLREVRAPLGALVFWFQSFAVTLVLRDFSCMHGRRCQQFNWNRNSHSQAHTTVLRDVHEAVSRGNQPSLDLVRSRQANELMLSGETCVNNFVTCRLTNRGFSIFRAVVNFVA